MRHASSEEPHKSPHIASSPSLNFVQSVVHHAGEASTGLLSKLDLFLEENKILPELGPPLIRSELESEEWVEIRGRLAGLKLSNAAVAEEEERRVKVQGELVTPLWVKAPFIALCFVLDILYDNKVSLGERL